MDRVPRVEEEMDENDDLAGDEEEKDKEDAPGGVHVADQRAGDALLEGALQRRIACSQRSSGFLVDFQVPMPAAAPHVHDYKKMTGVQRRRAEIGKK
jgi:hypothetical protein